jgi:hypothetical protein
VVIHERKQFVCYKFAMSVYSKKIGATSDLKKCKANIE